MSKKNTGKSFQILLYAIILMLIVFVPYSLVHSQTTESKPNEAQEEEVEHPIENSKCFECHGNIKYTMQSKDSSMSVTKLMPENYFVDSVAFYKATHKIFRCTDCHASDYNTVPHNGQLRFEPMPGCIDCHGGDPDFADFRFDEIHEQVQKSVHIKSYSDKFSCWHCHNPHSYKSTAHNPDNIKDLVKYNNSMCLECHGNTANYMLFSDTKNTNIVEQHDWLPNQELHFKSVRCIECHTALSDSVLVEHQILPKEKAVKKCVECHSSNSRLMHTLYKFKAKERRDEKGFFNGAILEESYVIGANRNYFLNVAGIVIFIIVIGGILIHGVLRIVLKKKK